MSIRCASAGFAKVNSSPETVGLKFQSRNCTIVRGLPSNFLFTDSARTIRGDWPPMTYSCQSTSGDVKAN